MKKYFAIFFLLQPVICISQIIDWIHPYDSVTSGASRVIYDGQQNLYFTGYLRPFSIPFDGIPVSGWGYEDGIVCKADTQGHIQWITVIGAYSSETAKFIFQTNDKLFIGGDITNWGASSSIQIGSTTTIPIPSFSNVYNGYVIQLDTTGAFQWIAFLPENIRAMTRDAVGNIYTLSSGFSGCYLHKISPAGAMLLSQQLATGVYITPVSVCTDAAGNVYALSSFRDSVNFMSTMYYSYGGIDILLSKFNSSGSLLYALPIGGSAIDVPVDIIYGNSGNLYMSGAWTDTAYLGTTTLADDSTRFFLAELDPAGNLIAYSDSDFRFAYYHIGSLSGNMSQNSSNEIFASINFPDSLFVGSNLYNSQFYGGYRGASLLAKWNNAFQLQWHRKFAESVYPNLNTGHASAFVSPCYNGRPYLCGQINEPVIIDSVHYDTAHVYIAYTALLGDTTLILSNEQADNLNTDASGKLNIFPNPATNEIMLYALSSDEAEIDVYNTLGKKVISVKERFEGGVIKLDVENLSPGIYLVKVVADDKMFVKKVVKE